MTLHNGSKILLSKLAEDYHPTDKISALRLLHEYVVRGEVRHGLIYVEPDKQDFVELLGMVDEPLATLPESKNAPVRRRSTRSWRADKPNSHPTPTGRLGISGLGVGGWGWEVTYGPATLSVVVYRVVIVAFAVVSLGGAPAQLPPVPPSPSWNL